MMADQIRFRAIINNGDATGDHDGGTSILVTIPEGLTDWQKINYITGHVATEVSRYLAHECLTALKAGEISRNALVAQGIEQGSSKPEGAGSTPAESATPLAVTPADGSTGSCATGKREQQP